MKKDNTDLLLRKMCQVLELPQDDVLLLDADLDLGTYLKEQIVLDNRKAKKHIADNFWRVVYQK